MNLNDIFTSKYLKAADLRGEMVKVTIREVTMEELGTDRKLVVHFAGKERGMVMNRTNARTIGDVYGDDTDGWIGKQIELFAMKVDFQGRMVDGLRVRVLPPPRKANIAPNARDRAEAPPPPPDDGYRGDMDDEIPFGPDRH